MYYALVKTILEKMQKFFENNTCWDPSSSHQVLYSAMFLIEWYFDDQIVGKWEG